ncbi:MAG TPA: hypothetical protein VGL53_10045 [Bryobacteraceae bacterium]
MTSMETNERKPVWLAMSDLFLDTDVRIWYPRVAGILAESPFTIAELADIFACEVAPIAEQNLRLVAGEWGGFDQEWLFSRILTRLSRSNRKSDAAHEDWQAVAFLISILRRLEESERPIRRAIWQQLSKFFLDRDPAPVTIENANAAALEIIWRDEMWPSYGGFAKTYRKHSRATYPSPEEIEQAWTRFKNALS